jgi:hypothetical protein
MKVSVTITVDIENPADWTLAFGVEGYRRIQNDVREYIGNAVQNSGVFGNGEVEATVTWK